MEMTSGKRRWFIPAKGWLTGPIFDKELRVSSRRRRSYALRFFYILLLILFSVVVWESVARFQGGSAFQQSRMASAGREIVTMVVWFQFVAVQVLAVIMLSNAISDEVYHRTLGLLMTTPIHSVQIVLGKVLSKLLQLVLLLGISLPILAIVRVFGGVSWDYLLSSLSITLTAALFAGSLTLLFSIRGRRAHAVIIRAAFVLGVLYFVVPATAVAVWEFVLPRLGWKIRAGPFASPASLYALLIYNPFFVMQFVTRQMLSPGGAWGVPWPAHCGIMLGLSALLLGWSAVIVRKVALWQATGQLAERDTVSVKRVTDASASRRRFRELPSRRVQGPPVVWRELRAPFIQGVDNRNSRIGMAVTILALLLTYLSSWHQGYLDEDFTHISYAIMFVVMGLIFTTVFSATRVTTEKESQTWSLLLVTPLSDWSILLGKAVSAFRRCLPIWGLLAGHVVFFALVGYIHPAALVHLLIVVGWLTCFIISAGLYFSVRFGRTTSAVVANFAVVLGLWAVGPILAGLLTAATDYEGILVGSMLINPVVQTELVMAGAAGTDNARVSVSSLEYGQERVIADLTRGTFGFGRMTAILAVIAGMYILAAMLFFWRAKRHLRRNVFG